MGDRLTRVAFVGGPILSIAVAIVTHVAGLPAPAAICAGTAILCAVWWISECIPMGVVGMVPLVIFPVTGVTKEDFITTFYWDSTVMLLMSGFFLSAAMENSGAHRRLALTVVRAIGRGGGKTLILAMMVATALISMWISNTATTLMMIPIALAVLHQCAAPELRTPLLLGIAYASSIGGMATPIGTPPNMIFRRQMELLFGVTYDFPQWMKVGVPVMLLLLPLVWWWLTRNLKSNLRVEVPEVGPWRTSEVRVLTIMALTAFAWTFRQYPYGGWTALLPTLAEQGKSTIGDMTIAIAASLAVFLLPSGEPPAESDERPGGLSPRLLSWSATCAKIPWGILLMFGGGLALAGGFQASGLSEAIADQFGFLKGAHPLAIMLAVCITVTFLTEVTSGTAIASLMLPILASLAKATGTSPAAVMIAGTISCSCAFMLPVATAPNAIVFSQGVTTREMARAGLMLNCVAAVVIALVCYGLID